MSEWIKCSDRLPEKDVLVLVWNGYVMSTAELNRVGGHDWAWDVDDGYVTHWMPLPEAPKAEDVVCQRTTETVTK